MRARYRHGWERPELVTPGRVERYDIYFQFFARRIPKGSRLQLIVGGINHPNWWKNYNSGGDGALETAKDARIAFVRLYHDKRYPSALQLPTWDARKESKP